MQLGYLGPEGSYSYEAALAYSQTASLTAMKTFSEIIDSVECGRIDEGILPMENSTEGAVTAVMDGLLKTSKTAIIGELILPIEHNLVSSGQRLQDIRYVYSHPQAIEQCRNFFQENYPCITLLPCSSSSLACIKAKENGSSYGAIAGTSAGKIHTLNILLKGIQDNAFNQTRFIIISQKAAAPTGRDKTSIAFSFADDRPGSLFSVLKVFAEEEINLTRIESRPAKAEIGKYIFFIDLLGHKDDCKVQRALSQITRIVHVFKILGSYPAHQ